MNKPSDHLTPSLVPFSDQQGQIDNMEIDNGEDKIILSGEITITRSQEGLQKIRDMLEFFKQAEQTLCQDLDNHLLPETEHIIPPVAKPNPFE